LVANVTTAAPKPDEPPRVELNLWVRIDPGQAKVMLGIDNDKASDDWRGFRPERKVMAPTAPYMIQQHEVTWGEIDPWLAKQGEKVEMPPWAKTGEGRDHLSVTGLTWSQSHKYCKSIGGSLPLEDQWEYAARGSERRPNAWGAGRIDLINTHAYQGANAVPVAVMSSDQDQTPGDQRHILFDMIGNVQEWTYDLWRDDRAGQDESWIQQGQTTYRGIRGLPLTANTPAQIQPDAAAYREPLCATGVCIDKTRPLLRYIGFRCARPVRSDDR
jgi:serine/threonine-protein kinase